MARKLVIAGIFLIVLLFAETVMGDAVSYRLAGIIASSHSETMAMIEAPDGTQFLLRQGDVVGDARVREITLAGAFLDFPDRTEFLPLTGKDYDIDDLTDVGIPASELRQRIQGNPDLAQAYKLPGLADMQFLSDDARAVAINGVVVEDAEQGLAAVLKVLRAGQQVRITLAGDSSIPVIYLNSPDSLDPADR